MSRTSEIGKRGEDIACEYLKKKKYKILERNARQKWGELDIVALAKDKTLVFVEVKTMRPFAPGGLQPEDQMTYAKRRKFERAASLYAGAYKNKSLIDNKKGWRLDVIAIVLIGEGRDSHDIRHYENI